MPMHKVAVTGEFHTHQTLWLHAVSMKDLRIENQNREAYGDFEEALACSMLLNIAFAVEAHANYLLELACPTEYEDERNFFSKGDYKGTLGKLCFLAQHLDVSLDKGSRPYQTLKELFDWRNLMVHSQIERQEYKVECADLNKIPLPESQIVNAYKAPWANNNRVFEDAKKLCSSLQGAAYSYRTVTGVLSSEAFSGFRNTRGIEIIASEP
jgi:hypothetical protein